MLPNFILVGAPKAGTTSLYYYLDQHPDVFMCPEKEPHHFAPAKWCSHPVPDRRTYENLFSNWSGQRAVGEASTGYLYYPESPGMIHATIPDCRIVAIIRDPVARAHSAWAHERREGVEPLSFEQALEEETKALRIIRGGEFSFNYRKLAYTADLLEDYVRLFGSDQVFIMLTDELESDPAGCMRDLFRFLEVDPGFEGRFEYRYNPSGKPRLTCLHELLDGEGRFHTVTSTFSRRLLPRKPRRWIWHRLRDWNITLSEDLRLDPATETRLRAELEPEVRRLEILLGRDLTAWRPRTTLGEARNPM